MSNINAALDGSLASVPMRRDKKFGFEVPEAVPGVEASILDPRQTWDDKDAFDAKAEQLVRQFIENFTQFEDYVDEEVRAAAPTAA